MPIPGGKPTAERRSRIIYLQCSVGALSLCTKYIETEIEYLLRAYLAVLLSR
jgi:hypothetical protein